MITFKELNLKPEILRSLSEIGFDSPTPIQKELIPLILESNRDLIGLAGTGTGKTGAFGLPILNGINPSLSHTQALILAPTRELAIQIATDLKQFGKYVNGLKVSAVYGGAPIDKQIREVSRGAHILVATPGRLIDLLKRKKVHIAQINTLILDEADEMLDSGFKDELNEILMQAPEDKLTLLLSATMSPEIARITRNTMNNPLKVEIASTVETKKNIDHRYYVVNSRNKYIAIKRTLEMDPEIYAIVFCRTRQETKELAEKFTEDGFAADAIHGDLTQAQRDQVLKKFRDRSIDILVATDVAARGIDVKNVSHVIHYSLPDEQEVYTHRSGRTGRAGNSGISIAVIHERETHNLKRISRSIGQEITYHRVPGKDEILENRLNHLLSQWNEPAAKSSIPEHVMNRALNHLSQMTREDLIEKILETHLYSSRGSDGDHSDLNVSFSEKDPSPLPSSRGKKHRGKGNPHHGNSRSGGRKPAGAGTERSPRGGSGSSGGGRGKNSAKRHSSTSRHS